MAVEAKAAARQILLILPPVMRTLAAELRQTGNLLAPAHFGVMVLLAYDSHNLSELASLQGVSLPTMSNTISCLEEQGWVRRRRADNDRRIVMVELTPQGREKLEDIRMEAEGRLVPLLDMVSQDDLEALSLGLVILQNIFTKG